MCDLCRNKGTKQDCYLNYRKKKKHLHLHLQQVCKKEQEVAVLSVFLSDYLKQYRHKTAEAAPPDLELEYLHTSKYLK